MVLFVNGSSKVALAHGVRLDGDTVRDEVVDATHRLNRSGAASLSALVEGRTVAETCDRLGVERTDMLALLEQLDSHDLIEVRATATLARTLRAVRSPLSLSVLAGTWLLTPPGRRTGRRYPATWGGVALAALRSQRLVLGMLALVIPLVAVLAELVVAAGDLGVGLTGVAGFLGHVWLGVAAFFLLTVLHERAHVTAAQLLGGRVLYVHSRGWAVSVVHVPLARGHEALVGVAGPAVAALAGVALGVTSHVLWRQPLGLQTSAAATVLAIGLTHLLSLGPWSEDGRSVLAWLHGWLR